jgi:branched-chain amino acid transport system substrate-binding protein
MVKSGVFCRLRDSSLWLIPILGLIAGWFNPVCAEPAPIAIGILTDMKGPYADLSGEGSVVAAEMAVADFGGRVLGRDIRIVTADHENKPAIAVSIAEEWFDHEHVGMITDLTNSGVALAVQKVAAGRNRISITVGAGSTDLTGKSCSPTGFHWAYDTYSNSAPLGRAMVGFGLDTWFFITVDYAFGWSLESEATKAVTAAGGKVVGSARHPLNSKDFVPYLSAGQDSNAKVIALANAGADTINTVEQAAEIGISPRSQTLVPLLVFISDVHRLGLDTAKGMTFIDGFYWDHDDASRAWSQRFFARRRVMPTMVHAGVYSAVLHYLHAVQAVGSDDAAKVAAKMRETTVHDIFAADGQIRPDGRMEHDMYLVRVKAPEQSQSPWDYYNILKTIPGKEAFRPLADSECPLVKKSP